MCSSGSWAQIEVEDRMDRSWRPAYNENAFRSAQTVRRGTYWPVSSVVSAARSPAWFYVMSCFWLRFVAALSLRCVSCLFLLVVRGRIYQAQQRRGLSTETDELFVIR